MPYWQTPGKEHRATRRLALSTEGTEDWTDVSDGPCWNCRRPLHAKRGDDTFYHFAQHPDGTLVKLCVYCLCVAANEFVSRRYREARKAPS